MEVSESYNYEEYLIEDGSIDEVNQSKTGN